MASREAAGPHTSGLRHVYFFIDDVADHSPASYAQGQQADKTASVNTVHSRDDVSTGEDPTNATRAPHSRTSRSVVTGERVPWGLRH
jgi:hypothetical protein